MIDGRFVPMTHSDVDNLIKTKKNANRKNKKISPRNLSPGISSMSI